MTAKGLFQSKIISDKAAQFSANVLRIYRVTDFVKVLIAELISDILGCLRGAMRGIKPLSVELTNTSALQ